MQLNGADIEHDVRGSGEPVVFIHGAILSDGFVPVIEGMPGHVRRRNAQVIQHEQTGIAENFRIVSITGAAATPVAHALRPA
jgi:hypothetical protein